jgi:hypothetical protein
MGAIEIQDRAAEFRIKITGKFTGDCVSQVSEMWIAALADCLSRQLTIDISGLTGYDVNGRKLLREIYLHGIRIAAATPLSLVFLNELSASRYRVTMIPERPARNSEVESKPPQSERGVPQLIARSAGGK